MNYYFYRFQSIWVQIFALKKLLLPLYCKLYDEVPNLCVDKTDYSILQDYNHCMFHSLCVHNSNRSLPLFDLSQEPRNKKHINILLILYICSIRKQLLDYKNIYMVKFNSIIFIIYTCRTNNLFKLPLYHDLKKKNTGYIFSHSCINQGTGIRINDISA